MMTNIQLVISVLLICGCTTESAFEKRIQSINSQENLSNLQNLNDPMSADDWHIRAILAYDEGKLDSSWRSFVVADSLIRDTIFYMSSLEILKYKHDRGFIQHEQLRILGLKIGLRTNNTQLVDSLYKEFIHPYKTQKIGLLKNVSRYEGFLQYSIIMAASHRCNSQKTHEIADKFANILDSRDLDNKNQEYSTASFFLDLYRLTKDEQLKESAEISAKSAGTNLGYELSKSAYEGNTSEFNSIASKIPKYWTTKEFIDCQRQNLKGNICVGIPLSKCPLQ